MGQPIRDPVIYLVGPTASGKTALAMALAERLGAEIVNADSRQVYRGLDVGTAKPTRGERGRVPHHVLDVAEPGEQVDAAGYARLAETALQDIEARGKRALVVGGTGLWVRALQRGLFPAPQKDPGLRRALEAADRALGTQVLHRRLAAIDPASASRIRPRDPIRVVRALEVWLQTQEPLSAHLDRHALGTPRHPFVMVGLDAPQAELAERIERRTRAMFAGGILGEARMLLDRGLRAWGEKLLGYSEVFLVLEGKLSVEEAIARTAVRTRQYAKRQRTWFRKAPVRWISSRAPNVDALAQELGA